MEMQLTSSLSVDFRVASAQLYTTVFGLGQRKTIDGSADSSMGGGQQRGFTSRIRELELGERV